MISILLLAIVPFISEHRYVSPKTEVTTNFYGSVTGVVDKTYVEGLGISSITTNNVNDLIVNATNSLRGKLDSAIYREGLSEWMLDGELLPGWEVVGSPQWFFDNSIGVWHLLIDIHNASEDRWGYIDANDPDEFATRLPTSGMDYPTTTPPYAPTPDAYRVFGVHTTGDHYASSNTVAEARQDIQSLQSSKVSKSTANVGIGTLASAGGTYSVAIGRNANAAGQFSIAEGSGAKANANGDIALGYDSKANGNGLAAIAIGVQATATNNGSIAIGRLAKSHGARTFNVAYDLGSWYAGDTPVVEGLMTRWALTNVTEVANNANDAETTQRWVPVGGPVTPAYEDRQSLAAMMTDAASCDDECVSTNICKLITSHIEPVNPVAEFYDSELDCTWKLQMVDFELKFCAVTNGDGTAFCPVNSVLTDTQTDEPTKLQVTNGELKFFIK